MNKLVSVIVPCYNQAQYLPEALQSVLDQTYSDWECIIVNDGSPDDTDIVAKDWLIKDSRFKYIYKENGGLSSARNAGIEIAIGDYIQFLDADDFLKNKKLELSLEALLTDSQNNIVITNFQMYDNLSKKSKEPYCKIGTNNFCFDSFLYRWGKTFSIPIHCALFKKRLFIDFQFPEKLQAREDWIMWVYLFQQEVKVLFIDNALVYYRQHNKSMTNNEKWMSDCHVEAILYLKNVVPDDIYIDFLQNEVKDRYQESTNLKRSIFNYQNTASFKIANAMKNSFLIRMIYNKMKC
ncbi:MAG: glycosyltransferase [Flavobacteriaceae bacterium]|nr:glycosyltransferase [Flavobacteriaceae bacterium]